MIKKMDNITLDDLATMIKRQFNGVDKRFDKVESEINGLRQEFNSFRFETRQQFDRLWREIKEINTRLDRLEKEALDSDAALADDIISLRKQAKSIERRVKKLELVKLGQM